MANARTRFDTIREYMVRSHGATSGMLYGKPCAMLDGQAFLYFHQEWAAFKLRGRIRLQALALTGARFWDPMGREGANMDWVIVPDAHFLRWDRLAIEAVKLAHGSSLGRRPMAGPAQGPVAPPPAAMRWIDSIKGLFAKAASLTLAQQEALPEKPISKLFAGPDLAEQDAKAIAELAEPELPTETPVSNTAATSPVSSDSEPADAPATTPSEGRASFSIEPEQAAPAAAPTGRASFVVAEDPAPPTSSAPGGRASFGAVEATPPASPSTTASGQPTIPPKPLVQGRASFGVGSDPTPAPSPNAAVTAALAAKAAAASAANPAPGRASFSVGTDPTPESVPESGSGAVAASMSTEEDLPPLTPSWATESAAAPETAGKATPVPETAAKSDAWADKIAKYTLEDDGSEPPAPSFGRAVFGAREPDPPAGMQPKFKIKEPQAPLGRASFVIADDLPKPEAEDEGGEALDYPPPSDTQNNQGPA